jgi:hypothetical protein
MMGTRDLRFTARVDFRGEDGCCCFNIPKRRSNQNFACFTRLLETAEIPQAMHAL